jgi:hypothetical protein
MFAGFLAHSFSSSIFFHIVFLHSLHVGTRRARPNGITTKQPHWVSTQSGSIGLRLFLTKHQPDLCWTQRRFFMISLLSKFDFQHSWQFGLCVSFALCRLGFIEVFAFDYGAVSACAFQPDALSVFVAYPEQFPADLARYERGRHNKRVERNVHRAFSFIRVVLHVVYFWFACGGRGSPAPFNSVSDLPVLIAEIPDDSPRLVSREFRAFLVRDFASLRQLALEKGKEFLSSL